MAEYGAYSTILTPRVANSIGLNVRSDIEQEGTDNDATAVTFFAVDRIGQTRLLILDWDIVQIEGAMLETWLPQVFAWLEELARLSGARRGSIGAFIEDKNSGTILLQQAFRRKCSCTRSTRSSPPWAWTSERFRCPGMSIVNRSSTQAELSKRWYQQATSRNHLLDQVESFRVGDRGSDREDDLLDTFCCGIALALGNSEGF
jgi:hypothetical protein